MLASPGLREEGAEAVVSDALKKNKANDIRKHVGISHPNYETLNAKVIDLLKQINTLQRNNYSITNPQIIKNSKRNEPC